jgi:hypothetical protein
LATAYAPPMAQPVYYQASGGASPLFFLAATVALSLVRSTGVLSSITQKYTLFIAIPFCLISTTERHLRLLNFPVQCLSKALKELKYSLQPGH